MREQKIIFTKKKATEIVGTLGHSSKMGNDVNNFGISVQNCGIGSKLHKCKGSVCENCYAYDGNYNYPSVQKSHAKRLENLEVQDRETWVHGMVFLIDRSGKKFFRWLDSGDFNKSAKANGIEFLIRIVEVAKLTPKVKHWIPAKEYPIIKEYLEQYGSFPENVVVRISDYMVDKNKFKPNANYKISTVISKVENYNLIKTNNSVLCHATIDGSHKCGECKKCWSKKYDQIVYLAH